MPIKVPNGLPAIATLHNENIFVINETRAVTQDIRPLQILRGSGRIRPHQPSCAEFDTAEITHDGNRRFREFFVF